MSYAFILSYDYPELSAEEAISSLIAENVEVQRRERVERILFIDSPSHESRIESASHRSATIREAIKTVCYEEEVTDPLRFDISKFRELVSRRRTFGVRVSINDSKRLLASDGRIIEMRLGSLFIENFPHLKVDLTSPNIWIKAIYVRERLAIGTLLCDSRNKGFSSRRPRRRPSFYPATLHPKLGRILVNLSKAKRGEVLLDPFCGVGGILIEGGLAGLSVVGCELYDKLVLGAKANLRWMDIQSPGIIRADSYKLPIKKANVIVTDPPYGTAASTAKRRPEDLYNSLLKFSNEILPEGGHLVLVHPKRLDLDVPQTLSLTEVFSYRIRIHRSLTRVIRVYKRENRTSSSD